MLTEIQVMFVAGLTLAMIVSQQTRSPFQGLMYVYMLPYVVNDRDTFFLITVVYAGISIYASIHRAVVGR